MATDVVFRNILTENPDGDFDYWGDCVALYGGSTITIDGLDCRNPTHAAVKFSQQFSGTFSDRTRVTIQGDVWADNFRPVCWFDGGNQSLAHNWDIRGCAAAPGTIVSVWSWLCLAVRDGEAYRIQTKLDYNFCVDAGAGLTSAFLWECNDQPSQHWEFDYDGSHQIFSPDVACLDVLDASLEDGAEVLAWQCGDPADLSASQMWEVNMNYGDSILNLNSWKCVSVAGGVAFNGAQLEQAACDGSVQQQFWFGFGTDTILTQLDNDYCLDAGSGWPSAVTLWECNGFPQQHWEFHYDGGHQIFSVDVGCLDVDDASAEDGAAVIAWECDDRSAVPASQKWEVNMWRA